MKGQAFDVFKLMIAAVIAVAILGILLTIMGQIVIPTQQPIPAMQSLLVDSYQYKIPKVSNFEVTFKKGELVPASQLEKSAGGSTIIFDASTAYNKDALIQCFVETSKTTFGSSCSGGTAYLNPQKEFKAKITTCCNDAGDCYVNIGETTYPMQCK